MAIKASRFVTHVKRLPDQAEPAAHLMAGTSGPGRTARAGAAAAPAEPARQPAPAGRVPGPVRAVPSFEDRRDGTARAKARSGRGRAATLHLVDRSGAAGARRVRSRAALGGSARPPGTPLWPAAGWATSALTRAPRARGPGTVSTRWGRGWRGSQTPGRTRRRHTSTSATTRAGPLAGAAAFAARCRRAGRSADQQDGHHTRIPDPARPPSTSG